MRFIRFMGKSFFKFFTLVLLILIPGAPLFAVPIERTDFGGAGALNARTSLISAAEGYLGTPYRYAGADKSGMDCSGLIYCSFRESLAVNVPRTAAELYSWAEKIPAARLRPGDLVFFVTGSGAEVTHVGIFTGNGRFIHSASEGPETGVMYSALGEAYWKRTYKGAGRVLPWNDEAEIAAAESVKRDAPAESEETPREDPALAAESAPSTGGAAADWSDSKGFFAGGGFAVALGPPSVFRGLAGQVKTGYKGLFADFFQLALEIRPEWDYGLGIVRLPLTLSAGTDSFQIFAGPAITIGKAALPSGEEYSPSFSFFGELGISAALPPIKLRGGAMSFFVEAAWQPYSIDENHEGNFSSDFTANTRFQAGFRYLHLIGK